MPTLPGTTVRRGGVTSRYWSGTIDSVAINASTTMLIRFSMPSKGGGDTEVQMEIRPESFPTILEMMTLVNRQAAMEAMSGELNRQILTQPERNAELTVNATNDAFEAVTEIARQNYHSKPSGEDEVERTVLHSVQQIISEIEKNTKK